MPAAAEPALVAAVCAGAGLLLAWLFAWQLRRQDARTFLFARAPRLPVRALSAHDDAWLRGVVDSERPLRCPWFDVPCVSYSYEIEEKRRESYRDRKGRRRTRTRWRNVHSSAEQIGFTLDDGDRVHVALPEGTCEAHEELATDYQRSDLRHRASVLPLGATVSAFGVQRDDRTFGPLRNVPLLVTRATRAQRVQSAASTEGALFCGSLLSVFLGGAAATAALTEPAAWPGWLLVAAAGLGLATPQWTLLTYNRLVRLRQQVQAAEKQISIELAQRADLVPNLVAVVEAASAHEAELLQRLAALRAGKPLDDQVRGEEQARGAARAVLVLHEQHPELTSDAVYRDLHERLWTIEEKIAHARGFYNDTVTEWNGRVEKVPSNLVAGLARMRPRPLFAAGDEVDLPPRLELDARS